MSRASVDVPVDVAARPARRRWPWVVAALLAVGLVVRQRALTTETPPVAPHGPPAVPVVAAPGRIGDLPVYLTALGSVTAFNTVTVKSRVDGQLVRVAFDEGQTVRAGDLLAEIDPRPFEVQLAQAKGQLARDAAQLANARVMERRTGELFDQKLVARQDLDNARAQVGQYEGAVQADQAAVDDAHLQLGYTRITAPIDGRVGLRLVDVGNMIRASDAGGIVVITQVQPIAVRFTMPEDDLRPVLQRVAAGAKLSVEAYDRAGTTKLATGTLDSIDNQIDPMTGTTRLKAVFDNADHALFPNQFVNVRLLLDVRRDAVVVPAPAIQRGPQGAFVFVVKADQTVEVRPVTVGPTAGADAVVESGVAAGEVVVVDGTDKLRAGSSVRVQGARDAPPPAGAHPAAAADAPAGAHARAPAAR
jgi:multidrug efflux system membrane fusion protein